MHPLLRRQLKRLGLSELVPPSAEGWSLLVSRISQTYTESDQDRYTLERSLGLSSDEMRQLYDDLSERSALQLAQRLEELRAAKEALGVANLQLERRVEERTAELRQTEEQLRQAQKMDAIGRLAGGVAHDFNNMLAVIISCAQMALEEIDPSAAPYEDLEQIRGAARRAAALTQQLLAFSRQQVLAPGVVDLNEIARDIGRMAARLVDSNIGVVIDTADHPVRVLVDRHHMEQALLNLVVNARDAMPGGGRLVIATGRTPGHTGETSADCAVLSVRDTGTGIPPELVTKIFEPFFTTKERGRGTGLGLATVYGVVKQSGGNIAVESREGEGTLFRITFPMVQAHQAPRAVTPARPRPAARGETVLVVEDEDLVRLTTVRILTREGYSVVQARDAAEASTMLESASVDLVLTDVVMPGVTGEQLAGQVRERSPDLPVLLMSGYLDPTTGHDERREHDIVRKPFSASTLLRAVRYALDGAPVTPGHAPTET